MGNVVDESFEENLVPVEIDFITVNNTRTPKTGGDYVYSVMKDELEKEGYRIHELSVPMLIEYLQYARLSKRVAPPLSLSEVVAYFLCYFGSLQKRIFGSHMMITSCSPTFPVFGDMTYHQPKGGVHTRFAKESDTLRRMIGYRIPENKVLSASWFFAKKLMKLHLSNSKFTKELVKGQYEIDSTVLYPPVPIQKYFRVTANEGRKPWVLVTKPEATTGISLLPEIVRNVSRKIKFVIIGDPDYSGILAMERLKSMGANFEHLGFVEEKQKIEMFQKCSVYLNLAVNETFGISVVEALAAGCVPIAHNSGAIPEFLPEEFRYSDPKMAAEKVMVNIACENTTRKKMRTIAARFDEQCFRKKFMYFVKQLEVSRANSC
jgi:glycosyltransferase involved in cell wall biosynthesis